MQPRAAGNEASRGSSVSTVSVTETCLCSPGCFPFAGKQERLQHHPQPTGRDMLSATASGEALVKVQAL